ncbi:pyridoxal phosphate-dependent aminotransferase [Collinsella intestinalis]|uniref:pyridoxal phosphate-dependent aminotransferase n=1 Tax=Collinsella intestinalis TaxID=147207 RepID=UPI0025A37E04|nr:aminotransferase class I/II-fold pyridoxal phosphate-dependent enzyme [Collinsella intestinalis]MDM8162862.1 aminotransferase class I/II-fold pyridoxal phosphate-dependent enzyme [Collinsella intestinalis]
MEFSKRLDQFGEEVFAALNQKRLALEAAGRTIYNLSVGTPDFAPYPHVMAALADAAADPAAWKYSLGDLPELKQAVCSYYERRFGVAGITPAMVTSCAGTQEGMGHLALTLLDPGDTALVPDPCYPVFAGGVKIAGGECVYYPLSAEHDFLPYVAGIDPAAADRAKYLVVSLPANPVGSVGTSEVYDEVIAFARAHDLLVVHDNAYSDIVFDGPRGGSFLAHPGALDVGVEFFSLSKSFNVTGARVSFLVGRPDVVAAFAKLRGQTDFGMFYPIQRAAIAALEGPLDEVEHQRHLYQERRDALCDGLERIGWERPNAHGTMFVWAKLPGGRTDSLAFSEELMERAGVVVTPGASFGPHGEGYVRMALVLPPEGLAAAVSAIERAGIR